MSWFTYLLACVNVCFRCVPWCQATAPCRRSLPGPPLYLPAPASAITSATRSGSLSATRCSLCKSTTTVQRSSRLTDSRRVATSMFRCIWVELKVGSHMRLLLSISHCRHILSVCVHGMTSENKQNNCQDWFGTFQHAVISGIYWEEFLWHLQ